MAEYKAKEGVEDRHGEMTGAISINMIMTMLPLTVWCFFIGPMLITSVWMQAGVGLIAAVVLTLVCFWPSRWVWAHISAFMENDGADRRG
jgi:hypothetical protein